MIRAAGLDNGLLVVYRLIKTNFKRILLLGPALSYLSQLKGKADLVNR